MAGFVKLNRDLLEWAWYGDNDTLAVYVRLLMGAAWRDFKHQNITLKRGQIVTSVRKIAMENGITERHARTILDRLKSTHKVTQTAMSKFSILTLVDYDDDFQNDTQNVIQTTSKRHTERQANDTASLFKEEYKEDKEVKNARAREGERLEDSFNRFWVAYPRKTAKQQALKAWQKLKPDEGLTDTILSALERFKQTEQWRKDNGQYIPYPATWLNGRRWEDETMEANTNGKNNGYCEMPTTEAEWLEGFE